MTTPVEFAEKDLGAQQVWEEFQQTSADLASEMRLRVAFEGEIRAHVERLADAEWEAAEKATAGLFAQSEGGKPPSEATIERVVRQAKRNDEVCASLRKTITEARTNLAASEAQVEVLRLRVKGQTARMELVAQQLAFFASCKSAETAARNQLLGNPGSRWPF